MTKKVSDREKATSENVVAFIPPARRIIAGEIPGEEESFAFLMRVLGMIRAERAGITNDNAK